LLARAQIYAGAGKGKETAFTNNNNKRNFCAPTKSRGEQQEKQQWVAAGGEQKVAENGKNAKRKRYEK